MKVYSARGWYAACDICGCEITFTQEHYAEGLCRSCRIGFISRRLELLSEAKRVNPPELWQDFPTRAHTPAQSPLNSMEIPGQLEFEL